MIQERFHAICIHLCIGRFQSCSVQGPDLEIIHPCSGDLPAPVTSVTSELPRGSEANNRGLYNAKAVEDVAASVASVQRRRRLPE